MDDTVKLATSLWPWLTTVVVVLGGVWALGQVAGPLADRPERWTALWLAIGLAILTGIGTMALVPTSSNPTGGPLILLLILGILLVVTGFVFLSGLLGYAVLARLRFGAIAVAGIIVGPLVLGGLAVLAVAWNRELPTAPYHPATVEPATGIDMSAEHVRVTTTTYRDPTTGRDVVIVGAVHLTMAVRFDDKQRRLPGSGAGGPVEITLRTPGFVMWADHMAQPPPLSASPDDRYPVQFTVPARHNFSAGELQALSQSGVWSLELQFTEEGRQYLVTAPVWILVDAPS